MLVVWGWKKHWKGQTGGKFTWKLMCPEFHQINGKGQVTNRDFENQLECWKCWWFRSKKQENKGQRVVKSFKKINASKIPPNQWKRLSYKQRLSKLSWICWKSWSFGVKQQWKRTNRGQNLHEINVSRIPPNQWKRSSHQRDFENQLECWKCWWFRSKKQEWQGAKVVKSFKKKCVQNSTKSMEKVKSPTEIMKINLYVENAGGLGVKKNIEKDKQGAKFTWKLMCPEFHQINGKGQVTNMDLKNQLERWKCWWSRSQKQENKGQTMVKIYMKMNVSRIPPNQ